VTGGEDESEEVVADVVVEGTVQVGGLALDVAAAAEVGELPLEALFAAEAVDGPVFGGAHEPGPRVVGDAGRRPLLQGGDQ
jgi:hypothetical protein